MSAKAMSNNIIANKTESFISPGPKKANENPTIHNTECNEDSSADGNVFQFDSDCFKRGRYQSLKSLLSNDSIPGITRSNI